MGAVENPAAPPLKYRVERAALKSDAGARFLQLQICYHPDRLAAFVAGCVERGIDTRTALLPTVCLTKSVHSLAFMHDRVPGIDVPQEIRDRLAAAPDAAEESYQITLELSRHALSLTGVAGLHITDFRHDGSLGRLVTELGLRPDVVATTA